MSILRAISLWQPWATCIAVGAKRIETRSWDHPYRGWVAIHAAKRWTLDQRAFTQALFGDDVIPTIEPPLGAFVAVARIIGVGHADDALHWLDQRGEAPEHEHLLGDFGPGRVGWLLADVRQLIEPVPARGQQALWTPTPDEVTAIRDQLPTRTTTGATP